MKKTLLFLFFAITACACYAVTIPNGTIYFDNSITQYSTVRFAYGYEDTNQTVMVTMQPIGNNVWSYTFSNKVTNVYRYIFLETTLPDDTYSYTFTAFKDLISTDRGEKRTATTDKTITPNYIFVPQSHVQNNWHQGEWQSKESFDAQQTPVTPLPTLPTATCNPHSGTIPVFYINTDGGVAITSKEEYLTGSLHVDALNIDGYQSAGSADAPILTEVKGRGNWTWTGFDKKPYRIKMNKKASLLNMTTDKSYNLLAHADDDYGFLRNTTGFALSRYFELTYTPTQEPVELFINGSYNGLYFLTDHIKVSSVRVNVTEQDDLETDPEAITGGWLLEIDNYNEDPHITIYKKDSWGDPDYTEPMWFTYKSPEELSSAQEEYITHFLNQANDAIYAQDKSSTEWEKYIDLDALVNYYLVYEIMGNREGFHGSCYLHKERGANTKLIYGPVWDFGNALRDMSETFIYEYYPFNIKWLDEIAKFPRFQDAVKKRWVEKRAGLMTHVRAEVDAFIDKITYASQCDCNKWPEYGNKNVLERKQSLYNLIEKRLTWLDSQFGTVDIAETEQPVLKVYPNPTHGNVNIVSDSNIQQVELTDLSGKVIETYAGGQTSLQLQASKGTYLLKVYADSGVMVNKIIIY